MLVFMEIIISKNQILCPTTVVCMCFSLAYGTLCRSRWPRGLRYELSSLARTLGSWVRIPLEAWLSVFSAFVLCVGRGLAMG
jgi:hypothetical protein